MMSRGTGPGLILWRLKTTSNDMQESAGSVRIGVLSDVRCGQSVLAS